ncbi:MAG: membrane protein insertase YidC, partial [Candidatus Omnitrophica bacterium]|nr:membrane protein insertase YidC [Candidatus Omnitrophota bacterium]
QGNVQFDSIIYAGPEKIDVLKEYGLGFEKIRKYYRFALFDGIAKIIASLMRTLHKIIPSWGICIILISIIIYFSMYPLTMRGMLSMKRMQSLQPMIVKLKEKYKDNPQRMNKEMMGLYKEHKVNPLGGCLPMLLQMPVFIGLYQVLWRSVSFKGAQFLWIKDLSQPDRLFIFPFSLPIIGNELNLLPLIMVVVMFFQQKLSAKNMVAADPSQAAQQKMMATIMPIFLGFIFYKFASGLTLYFTMFYFFSTFTQWKMSKSVKVG